MLKRRSKQINTFVFRATNYIRPVNFSLRFLGLVLVFLGFFGGWGVGSSGRERMPSLSFFRTSATKQSFNHIFLKMG